MRWTIVIILIVVLAVVLTAVFGYKIYNSYKERQEFLSHLEEVKSQINDFQQVIRELDNVYIDYRMKQQFIANNKEKYAYLKRVSIPKNNELFEVKNSILSFYTNFEQFVSQHNKEYIASELTKNDELLSNIDGKSLDKQQRTVVVTDEINNLVIAGAGSGKTLTIVGKVKYLCGTKGIKPEEILLLAFTRKSAQEMTDRINTKLNISIEATTFHKLGLDIIKEATGERPDVFDNFDGYISDFFDNKVSNDKELIKALIEYFAYYLEIPTELEDYDCLGDVYDHEKSADLETLKSKYQRDEYIEEKTEEKARLKKTLAGEQVKSLEEVSIANFLFLNGIEYEYERKYPFESDDKFKKAYRPDFYLPEYDLYIEHFGITKENTVPWLSDVEGKKYIQDMEWKREFHKKNGTKLIESYSYYSTEGCLLPKLKENLTNNGVQFKEVDFVDIFNKIYANKSDKYFNEFIKLCTTFVNLYKANGYEIDELDRLKFKTMTYNNEYYAQRFEVFKQIIKPVLVDYAQYLKENDAIDFSDMIGEAVKCINAGKGVKPYKYVIVDEFQDISVGRYRLVKAIIDKTQAKLLCVGDDWQSIYRFTGSDISLFTEFEKFFGYTEIMKIEKTYRNSQELINVASKFITMNPKQIKKQLKSGKELDKPLVIYNYEYGGASAGLHQIIKNIVDEFGEEKNILLLGRTSYDDRVLIDSGLFELTRNSEDLKRTKDGLLKLKEYPNVKIEFLTVHKSKGLEADNVIILNFANATLGFPNKISDDPILETVLCNADGYTYAEERRLLYVAMTRTKNRTYILAPKEKPSEFYKEFATNNNVYLWGKVDDQNHTVYCPKCQTGILIIRKNEDGKEFVGCSNYPKCDFTDNHINILTDPIRCRRCGGFMVPRVGMYGKFLGCNNYPICTNTLDIEE